jgi:hypothetical protein
MIRVGIDELRNLAEGFFSSGETLAVEQDGKTIGFYIPIKAKDRSAGRAALEDLENVINGILEPTRMTEDELITRVLNMPFNDGIASEIANP